jgi:hypothetical protein
MVKGKPMSNQDIVEIREVEPVFGNGLSLKFFNVLFKVLIYFNIPALLLNAVNLYNVSLSYGSVSRFFSVYGNITTVLFQLLGAILIIRLVMYSVKNQPQEFAYLFLFVSPINLFGSILSLVLYFSQYPAESSDFLVRSLPQIIVSILIYIPMFIYLKKRLIKKPKLI